MLGVEVKVGAVDLSFEEKRGAIKKLVLANPEGFKKPFSVRFKDMSVQLGDVSKDLIVIKDITISGADINYTAQNGGSNLMRIAKQLEENQKAEAAKPKKINTSDFNIKEPKIIIEKFTLENVKVFPEMKIIAGQGVDTDLNLSDVVLENIGKEEGGVAANKAAEVILSTIIGRVRNAAARAGFFEGLSSVALLGVTGGIPVVGMADEVLDTLDTATGGIVGSIFGGSDEEDDKDAWTDDDHPEQKK